MKLPLATPLLGIRGISPSFIKRLEKMGLKTIRDLLWHFPSRYEDFSKIYKISELEPGQHATIQGAVEDIAVRRTWKKRITIVEATVVDESGSIRAVWFNQPYLANTLRPGRIANFAGKVSLSDEGEVYLSHPAYELLANRPLRPSTSEASKSPSLADASRGRQIANQETKHTARLVPIYPETKGLTSKGIRFLVQPVLKNIQYLAEWVPEETLTGNNLPEINKALHGIHFPENIEEAEKARRRFEFENIFLLHLYNLSQKLKLAKEKSPELKADIEWLKGAIARLPFELTMSQKRSLWEMVQDAGRPSPMNRLLQGDVGSGKTVVAALVAVITAKNGYQSAFMAPTEVLAKQHFETLRALFGGIAQGEQPSAALLTSSDSKVLYENDTEADVKKEELLQKIKSGEIKVVIGTHALIQEDVSFGKLGFVVVDEQHRFGVKQRAQIARQNSSSLTPHFLSMSATPIPRTLMMTVFGDLDISLITELPAGRKKITTQMVSPAERKRAYDFIRAQVKEGRQVFVICPRIEAANSKESSYAKASADKQVADSRNHKPSAISPKQLLWDVKSVKEEYKKFSEKIFPDLRVGMLHGKLKPKDKEKVMRDFRDKKIDILVSTSVIEVGVDIPNASVMMIEGADRFGLAQLYQFRGRVGRAEYQSYCLLFTDSSAESTQNRLKALIDAKNGFELAEYDLKFRGPGEFLGESQSGMPDYAMRALQDPGLVKASREAAAKILNADRNLEKHPRLQEKLGEFEKGIHLE